MEEMRFRDWLSEKQRVALDALVYSGSPQDAAALAAVDEETVRIWLSTDNWFIAAVKQEEKSLSSSVVHL